MDLDDSYKEKIKIDPDNLDLECLYQPQYFMEYAEMLAKAENNLDIAKRNLDRVCSKKSLDIRKNPENYISGINKLTENMIQSLLDNDAEVDEANNKIIECKHDVKVLSAIVDAFEQKKRSINNLVVLHGQQYYSGPDSIRPLNREFIKSTSTQIAKDKIRTRLSQRKDLSNKHEDED